MGKLNQAIAVLSGLKNQVDKDKTSIYHRVQKPELFEGLSRRYEPMAEDGETLPPEYKKPQQSVSECVEDFRKSHGKLLDLTATVEYNNTLAKANVEVDGVVVLENVPVTYLLFLEKQLVDLRTFFSSLPTLSKTENWHEDKENEVWKTEEKVTLSTKKVIKDKIVAEATEHHPAQVHIWNEDVPVGRWYSTKESTAMSPRVQREQLERVNKLIEAVKRAREEANSTTVEDVKVSENLYKFILNE